MDSRVHARFFRVSKPSDGTMDFHDILLEDMKIPKCGDREREVGEDLKIRLERCVLRDDYIEGEFCRVQTVNIPPGTGPDGLEPIALGPGKGIGHVVAFCYHIPTRVLLIQRNISSVTVGRLALYLVATKAGRIFGFQPVLSKSAMARFMDRKPRGFAVTFAGPENLAALDDAGLAAARGAKLIAEAYHGVRVKIEVSVGRSRKKWLQKESILEDIGALMDADGVKSLKVKAEKNGEDDLINFLKEQLQADDTLKLPEGKPDDNYQMRKLFLRTVFSDNLVALKDQFG